MLKSYLLWFPPQKELLFSEHQSGEWLSLLETVKLFFSLRSDCEVVTVTTILNLQCLKQGHYLSLKGAICFLNLFSKFVMCAELYSFGLKLKEIILKLSISENKSNGKKYQPV